MPDMKPATDIHTTFAHGRSAGVDLKKKKNLRCNKWQQFHQNDNIPVSENSTGVTAFFRQAIELLPSIKRTLYFNRNPKPYSLSSIVSNHGAVITALFHVISARQPWIHQ